MNDSPSHSRKPQLPPSPVETGTFRADGSSAARRANRPTADDRTIITSAPPIPNPSASDSVARVLEGRLLPGDRIGHFELIEFVGGGGMGRVFRALDTLLGRTVALKVLPPETANADATQRFQNEAQSAARLDHENIARVYFVGEDRGLSYIVFEFVEGVHVRSLVEQKGPLPLDETLSYIIQVTEALAHADSRGVVHRDIKPSNVLITPEGRVKLIDMGLARLRTDDPASADLTQSGVTLGTFDYISPEQARDPRNADIRSDIYSLGCTVFFMLSGQPPFPEGTVLQKLLQHQGDQPPDIRRIRPDLPEEFGRILRKMMAKDPRHRYANAVELAADLLALADQIGLRPMSPASRVWLTPPVESVSFFQRHVPWMAPVAALLCIVVLVGRLSAPRDDALPPLIDVADKDLTERSEPKATAPIEEAPQNVSPNEDTATTKTSVARKAPAPTTPKQPSQHRPFFTIEETDSPSLFPKEPFPMLPMTPIDAAESNVTPKNTDLATTDSREASPVVPAKRSGVLIVTETPAGDYEFSTLSAACAEARNGDVIELRFNGRREERPLKLPNLQVTIRPGEGYRPVIVFRPTEIDPVICPRSMFTLTAGRLTMTDLSLELYVPREVPADNWAIFETWGGQTVQLEQCSLTVRNASDQLATYHQEVAFIRAKPAPDANVTVDNSSAATPLTTIELTDCVARGEAVFLCVEDLQPVYLRWNNGLLATTEQLLTAAGGQTAPKPDEALRLELRHLTAAVRGGLCRLTRTSANPYQLTVQFECTDNIIITGRGAPLIEQDGTTNIEKSRQRLVWNGDRNYYQGVDVFWLVRSADSQIMPDSMDYDEWKTHWGMSREKQPSHDPLAWRRTPDADRPLHTHAASDYSLEDPTFNDAARGAPGCRADRLPSPPSDSFIERSTSPSPSARDEVPKEPRKKG